MQRAIVLPDIILKRERTGLFGIAVMSMRGQKNLKTRTYRTTQQIVSQMHLKNSGDCNGGAVLYQMNYEATQFRKGQFMELMCSRARN